MLEINIELYGKLRNKWFNDCVFTTFLILFLNAIIF
jgi:hypothetical protein